VQHPDPITPSHPEDLVQIRGSIARDGRHVAMHPADVHGRFTRARQVVFFPLIGIYLLLPWTPVGGHPAVFIDLETRHFYLFGLTFNAQDFWLMTFLLTGGAFGLVYVTALLGRVWCGWACPQTVYLEGVYRRIERFIQGPREKRLRRNAGELTWDRAWRKMLTHALWIVVSAALAHVFLSYFTSLPALWMMMHHAPSAHPEAFAIVLGVTGVLYFNFAWFREQFCVVVCPYGRLQSVLLDKDSLIIGYDKTRGEPRGKGKERTGKGDCVDCNRCVVVCPTGIDIRNGLQMDCVACAACIDACDDVMERLHKPRGLIRYASESSLEGGETKILRPRVYLYTALMFVGLGVALFAFRERPDVEAVVRRLPGAPFVIENGNIRNAYEIHLVNKRSARTTFTLEPDAPADLVLTIPVHEVTLDPLEQRQIPVFATFPQSRWKDELSFHVRFLVDGHRVVTATAPFLGP
jgi:cytochrome c oxidase accessory protein FixG